MTRTVSGCAMGSDKVRHSSYNIQSGVRLGDRFSPSASVFSQPTMLARKPLFPGVIELNFQAGEVLG
ncbi:MAG: hypothetical protein ABJ208_16610, partial [Rhodopirellula bahusiensis]